MSDPAAVDTPSRRTLARSLVAAVVLGCFALLARAFVVGYDDIDAALAMATWWWLGLAVVASLGAMVCFALLWRASLTAVGQLRSPRQVIVWFFAGELGKYLPGGIWTVVGRGEVAARHGVERTIAYLTVVVALLVAIVGGLCAVAMLGPTAGGEPPWVRWGAPLVAVAALCALHPRCTAILGRVTTRATRGRMELVPRPWTAMLKLTALALPAWAFVGVAAWTVAEALHLEGSPSRIALAAIAAWVAGLLAVPVPSGAGVREIVFIQASGLDVGPAVLLATTARLIFLMIDGLGGALALRLLRLGRGDGPDTAGSICPP